LPLIGPNFRLINIIKTDKTKNDHGGDHNDKDHEISDGHCSVSSFVVTIVKA